MKQNHLNRQFVLQHFNQTSINHQYCYHTTSSYTMGASNSPYPFIINQNHSNIHGYPQMMSLYYSTKDMVIVFILNVINQNIITIRSQLKSLTTSSCSIWGISPNSGCIKYFLVGEPTNTP